MLEEMTETEVLTAANRFFLTCDADRMELSRPSKTVIEGLGLRATEGTGTDRYALHRNTWCARAPYVLRSARIEIRPFVEADLAAFHQIAGQLSVARMLVNISHPLSFDMACRWIKRRRFTGRLGFMVGVFNHDGRLLGAIGIGGLSNSLVYFLSEDARGAGLGTEVVSLFIRDAIPRFALKSIFAGVFSDNPASRRLLEKLGFVVKGTADFKSPARQTSDLFWEMELDCKHLSREPTTP